MFHLSIFSTCSLSGGMPNRITIAPVRGRISGCFSTLFLLGCWASGCGNNATAEQAVTTPDKQFVLQDLHIEQRRDGKILWSGIAQSSDGDLTVNDVQNLKLSYVTETDATVTLVTDKAHIDFEQKEAWFEPLNLTDAQGATLTGKKGSYSDARAMLSAQGPIVCTIPQTLHLTGEHAQVDLKHQRVVLDGPVYGRWYPSETGMRLAF